MKRTAFTMIELVFVIVVLGILAAVIVQKINAVRTDARATQTIADFNNCVRNVTAYAFARNQLPVVDELCENSVGPLGGITVTPTTVTATIKSTLCASGTLYPNGDFNVTIVSTAGDCEVFGGQNDSNYKLRGGNVVR